MFNMQAFSDEDLIRILVNNSNSKRFVDAAIIELGERSKALYAEEMDMELAA